MNVRFQNFESNLFIWETFEFKLHVIGNSLNILIKSYIRKPLGYNSTELTTLA